MISYLINAITETFQINQTPPKSYKKKEISKLQKEIPRNSSELISIGQTPVDITKSIKQNISTKSSIANNEIISQEQNSIISPEKSELSLSPEKFSKNIDRPSKRQSYLRKNSAWACYNDERLVNFMKLIPELNIMPTTHVDITVKILTSHIEKIVCVYLYKQNDEDQKINELLDNLKNLSSHVILIILIENSIKPTNLNTHLLMNYEVFEMNIIDDKIFLKNQEDFIKISTLVNIRPPIQNHNNLKINKLIN